MAPTQREWQHGGVRQTAEPVSAVKQPVDLSGEPQRPWLAKAIEREIIPRLLMAHSGHLTQVTDTRNDPAHIAVEDVAEFGRIVLAHDDATVAACIDAFVSRGISRERLCLDLIAPVARAFGEGWEQDTLDFTEVTIGLGRLQRIVHRIHDQGGPLEFGTSDGVRRIVLAPVPGEQHTLGLLMVADSFRNAGWTVWHDPDPTPESLQELVRNQAFDVLGLSLSCDRWLDSARKTVQMARAASQNADLRIIFGGHHFVGRPDLLRDLGGDAVARDGRDALTQAQTLVEPALRQ